MYWRCYHKTWCGRYQQRFSWEANTSWAIQEIAYILWNPKVHYRVHKIPPLFSICVRSLQSTSYEPISLRSISILYFRLRSGLQSSLFALGFLTKTLYASLLSSVLATLPVHLILLDLFTRIMILVNSMFTEQEPLVSQNLLIIEASRCWINRPNRRRRLVRPLEGPLNVAEIGLSRSNTWRMIMMTTVMIMMTITLRHAELDRTSLDEWSARRRQL